MTDNLFCKPPADWSDNEIRVGLAEVAKAIQWHSDQHDPAAADRLHAVARVLADERDARAGLRAAVDDAVLPAVNITDLLAIDGV